MKKINVAMYGGKGIFGGREQRLNVDVAYCDKSKVCTFYEKGECFNAGRWGANCKIGKKENVEGYTSRAAKYYDFKNKWKKDEFYNKLKETNKTVGIVGDIVIINIPMIDINENNEVKNDTWNKRLKYIPLKKFDNHLIKKICNARPRTLFDNMPIKSYYEETIPRFLDDLKRHFNDIYKKFIAEFPEYDKEINYIGRKALLSTIKADIEIEYKSSNYSSMNERWYWNGETLKYIDGYVSSNNITDRKSIVNFEIMPTEKATIIITDNDQVIETTEFVD